MYSRCPLLDTHANQVTCDDQVRRYSSARTSKCLRVTGFGHTPDREKARAGSCWSSTYRPLRNRPQAAASLSPQGSSFLRGRRAERAPAFHLLFGPSLRVRGRVSTSGHQTLSPPNLPSLLPTKRPAQTSYRFSHKRISALAGMEACVDGRA